MYGVHTPGTPGMYTTQVRSTTTTLCTTSKCMGLDRNRQTVGGTTTGANKRRAGEESDHGGGKPGVAGAGALGEAPMVGNLSD